MYIGGETTRQIWQIGHFGYITNLFQRQIIKNILSSFCLLSGIDSFTWATLCSLSPSALQQTYIIIMFADFKQRVKSIFTTQPVSLLDCPIYPVDLQSLYQHQWLRSEAISLICAIIRHKHPFVFSGPPPLLCKIVDPSITAMLVLMGDQQFILESMRGQQLFEHRYWLMPCNTETEQSGQGSHWFLAIYDTCLNKIWTIDSYYEKIHTSSLILAQRVRAMRGMFVEGSDPGAQVQVEVVRGVSRQPNNWDCGVYVLGNVERMVRMLEEAAEQGQGQERIKVEGLGGDEEFYKGLRMRYLGQTLELLQQQLGLSGS